MTPLSEITEQLLQRARIEPAMRVLDIGCGSGEVTRALAERVGAGGCVVGVDGSAAALAVAQETTDPVRYANISYLHSDLSELAARAELGEFDAIVGRRVLMYVPKPQSVLAQLVSMLKPGGTLAFQEHDATLTPGRIGHWPVHDQVNGWLWNAVKSEGVNTSFGFALPAILSAAGAQVQTVWAQAIFSGFETGFHHRLHDLVKMMQPRLLAAGVATEAEIDLPTLEVRLAAERDSHKSSYISDMAICVVAQRPKL